MDRVEKPTLFRRQGTTFKGMLKYLQVLLANFFRIIRH